MFIWPSLKWSSSHFSSNTFHFPGFLPQSLFLTNPLFPLIYTFVMRYQMMQKKIALCSIHSLFPAPAQWLKGKTAVPSCSSNSLQHECQRCSVLGAREWLETDSRRCCPMTPSRMQHMVMYGRKKQRGEKEEGKAGGRRKVSFDVSKYLK